MKHKSMFLRLMSLGLIAVLTACGGGTSTPTPDPFFKSEDAFGKTLPEGAQTVTPDEFKRRVGASEGQVISKSNFEAIKKADHALVLEDQKLVQPIIDAHPEYGLKIAAASPKDLNTDGDQLADVDGTSRTLMGRRWHLAQIASNLRTFPSLENQRRVYSDFRDEYVNAIKDVDPTAEASLPSAAEILNAPLKKAQDANALLYVGAYVQYKGISDRLVAPLITAPSDPATEVGAGQQLDRTPSSLCANGKPSANSIFGQFDWPLKKFTTSVKDQGARGTCWGFATVANLEIEIARKTGIRVNLSEQDYAAHRFVRFAPRSDGDGGDPTWIANKAFAANFEFALENGLQYNASLKRNAKTATTVGGPLPGSFMDSFFEKSCLDYPLFPCSDTTAQGPIVCAQPEGAFGFVYCLSGLAPVSSRSGYKFSQAARDFWNMTNPDFSTAILAVRASLGHPFALSHSITDDPKTPRNEMFNFRPDFRGFLTYDGSGAVRTGDHVVTVVGFITQEKLQTKMDPPAGSSGKGFFIIKNSWGHCWGDGGYAYLDYDWLRNYAVQATEIR
jgi:Papain family cysteine protease